MTERDGGSGSRARLLAQIRDYLHEQREVDPQLVQERATFRDDLAIDSLDLAAMALTLEDEYGVRLDDEQIMTIQTVGDALDVILATVSRHEQTTSAEQ
ncbi:MAG TPA: acyl carrier protein [Thermoleophilaceae bacterium]|jgi:acyl carrier protein